jgi:hypothetical protein
MLLRVIEPERTITMRRFIASAALAFSLFGLAGLADAREIDRPGREIGHGPVVVRGGVDMHFRDFHRRPAPYAEHIVYRSGYNWHPGAWRWNGAEWIWGQGYYVRVVL